MRFPSRKYNFQLNKVMLGLISRLYQSKVQNPFATIMWQEFSIFKCILLLFDLHFKCVSCSLMLTLYKLCHLVGFCLIWHEYLAVALYSVWSPCWRRVCVVTGLFRRTSCRRFPTKSWKTAPTPNWKSCTLPEKVKLTYCTLHIVRLKKSTFC